MVYRAALPRRGHGPGGATVSAKDTAAIIEIDRVMLESGAHWPDVKTDALVVRHVKELTRMLNAERAAVQALRDQVSRAYQAGTDDFRRFYDAELFAVIGVTGFWDMYAPAGSVPSPTAYLVKAGALILAEIERLDRAAIAQAVQPDPLDKTHFTVDEATFQAFEAAITKSR